jgi:hypothetical protein
MLNAGQARTLLLTGNVNDLFAVDAPGGRRDYLPLVDAMISRWSVPGRILAVYELNGPVRFVRDGDREKVRDAWLKWRTGLDADGLAVKSMLSYGKVKAELQTLSKAFDENLSQAVGNPTLAFELLRQMCLCSRSTMDGAPVLAEDLIVIVEAADMAIPEAEISHLSEADRHRVAICHDWFSDPGFTEGGDAVLMIAESRSLLHRRIAQLPQILEVEVPAPDHAARETFIAWFQERLPEGKSLKTWGSREELARATAGLSVHALRQLLKGAAYQDAALAQEDVTSKVEQFIQSQLGEDIVEFKKPTHGLDDVMGFTSLKKFIRKHLMPRLEAPGAEALSGAAVCGPIGGGKTFIFEAMAAELDMVVLVLKNLRSQWYGQTDVIFERLRRVLTALDKVLIFVDEADTQFGGVSPDTHETERRLTGKIQAMMSDTQLRGHVTWLLMTARIHLLSPDIRRPGRVGDLIIPVLDPEGDDKKIFLQWMVEPALKKAPTAEQMGALEEATRGYFSASYASLRAELKARARKSAIAFDEVLEVVRDWITPDIGPTRRYQTLQALVNCTRRSLLPDPAVTDEQREAWAKELRALEARGIS